MARGHRTVALGLAGDELEPGIHICQVYSNDQDRRDSLLAFIRSGLESKERTTCFSEKATAQEIEEYLADSGLSYEEAVGSGDFTLAGTDEIYFQDGTFDPDRMLGILADYEESSADQGYPGARVIGEMTPTVTSMVGGDRLIEYEARVSLFVQEHPITAVCQYDAREFDGATIMDILRVHPLLLVHGSVVENPYYSSPDEVLA